MTIVGEGGRYEGPHAWGALEEKKPLGEKKLKRGKGDIFQGHSKWNRRRGERSERSALISITATHYYGCKIERGRGEEKMTVPSRIPFILSMAKATKNSDLQSTSYST